MENLSGWVFNETDLVLDIGSGNGRVTANIAKQVPFGKVIGLDIDPAMYSFANNKYPHTENPNLEFIQGNACELNFFEAFDKITILRGGDFFRFSLATTQILLGELLIK